MSTKEIMDTLRRVRDGIRSRIASDSLLYPDSMNPSLSMSRALDGVIEELESKASQRTLRLMELQTALSNLEEACS